MPMITIKKFSFNPFDVNTYLLYDETRETVIIDSGNYGDEENTVLSEFIEKENLTLVRQLYTHCHIDHFAGMIYVTDTYNIPPEIHEKAVPFVEKSQSIGATFGFRMSRLLIPDKFIKEGDVIRFGNSSLDVIYTPGHANGSVCFVCKEQNFVIVGDVLFAGCIGRTDFPTGDFKLLEDSIRNKLYTLGDDFTVYPGHGPKTEIGYEKENNPFVTA